MMYKGSVKIDSKKLEKTINEFVIKNRIQFKRFLEMLGETRNKPVSSATYSAWVSRGVMRADMLGRIEEMGIDSNLFIK